MNAEQHAKILCILHLSYGTITALPLFILLAISAYFRDPMIDSNVGSLLLLVIIGYSIPFLATAYGLLHDKSWARITAVLSVVFSLMVFPVGTLLAGYTLWYFFGGGNQRVSF